MSAPEPTAADLAPGDRRFASFDWSGLELLRVGAVADPWFAPAWERLWREFGARGEMEQRGVIADRLGWNPACERDGRFLAYEMLAVVRAGRLVAVRDHSAIVAPDGLAVVHLSHVLVEPELRGSGLAGWLRALPIRAARACAAAAGVDAPLRIVLAAEMEPLVADDPATLARLRSYERAGFRALDAPYAQPDFRTQAEIAATGFRPLPLRLVLRRVGREDETAMPGAEAAAVVAALYAMFGVHLRPPDVDLLRERWEAPLAAVGRVDLLPPTR